MNYEELEINQEYPCSNNQESELEVGQSYYCLSMINPHQKQFGITGMDYFIVLKKQHIVGNCWYTIYSFVVKKFLTLTLTPEYYLSLDKVFALKYE